MAEEEPEDINAYERFVLDAFNNADISWMPLGKAITMGSQAGGSNDEQDSIDAEVAAEKRMDEMKIQLETMQKSMEQLGVQVSEITKLLGKGNGRL